MSDSEAIVKDFCAAFERGDVDELLGFLADDCLYHNIPLEPAVGHAAIRGMFDMFLGMATKIVFEVHHVATTGNVVLTERTDHFDLASGKKASLPVMGTFEVGDDGKITAWRDYFDMQQFNTQIS
jgi:limonene-1,2-epoxide hydrolase